MHFVARIQQRRYAGQVVQRHRRDVFPDCGAHRHNVLRVVAVAVLFDEGAQVNIQVFDFRGSKFMASASITSLRRPASSVAAVCSLSSNSRGES